MHFMTFEQTDTGSYLYASQSTYIEPNFLPLCKLPTLYSLIPILEYIQFTRRLT